MSKNEISEEFINFHRTDLLPHLEALDDERKKLFQGLIAFVIIYLACVFISIYFVAGFHEFSLASHSNMDFIIAIGLLVLWAIIGVLVYKKLFQKRFDEIRHEFKRKIVARVVSFVDEGLSYHEEELISKTEYDASKLFPIDATIYTGEDYVLGRNDKTSFKFSELHSQHTMKDQKGRKLFMTIFQGLFFIADFNKHFKSHTVVLPDTAQKLFGEYGDHVQEMNMFRDDLIKMDHKEFDNTFVVYGTDPVEARYILSESLMQQILDFKHKSGHKIHISFINNHVNVAIPLDKDLFEPPLMASMMDVKEIYDDFHYLKLVTGIVKDLNLNTRIWSKV